MILRKWSSNLLDIVALWGVAVVQPLLSILGTNTEYFIRFGIPQRSMIGFAVLAVAVVPLVIAGVEAALTRVPRAWDAFHLGVVAVFGALVVGQVLKFILSMDGVPYVAAAVASTGAGAWLWRRFDPVRQWMRLLAVVPVAAVAMFVFASPAGRYARASTEMLSVEGQSDVPVVMVMFDEFPLASLMDGHGAIDEVRYPNFARLAAMSTWYRQYTTVSEVTTYAIPAALSGLAPVDNLSASYVDHPKSIFSLLAESHQLHVSEVVTQLCEPAVCTAGTRSSTSTDWRGFLRGIGRLYRQRVDTTQANEFNAVAGVEGTTGGTKTFETSGSAQAPEPGVGSFIALEQTARFGSWMDGITRTSKPLFAYAHVLQPHQPWVYAPSGINYGTDEQEFLPDETKWETRVFRQRHMLQLQHVDALIGELLDKLDSTGLLDEALVVVTADHGVSLMNGYARRYANHDYANAREIMGVPLFVKEPGVDTGRVSDANVQTTDLLPIIAKSVGIDVPWRMDGAAPASDAVDRAATKTLLFQINRFNAEDTNRREKSWSVGAGDYADWILSTGSEGVPGDPLAWLYDGLSLAELRGRRASPLVSGGSGGKVVLDGDITKSPVRILLRGTVEGVPAGAKGLAVADATGRIVGVAPFERAATPGRFMTVVVSAEGDWVRELHYYVVAPDGSLLRASD